MPDKSRHANARLENTSTWHGNSVRYLDYNFQTNERNIGYINPDILIIGYIDPRR